MKLIIIRGLPGSGKSTFANKLAQKTGLLTLEADQFFVKDGLYQFDRAKIQKAHDWCKRSCDIALSNQMDVVVSNTFVTLREIEPYLEMAKKHQAEIEVLHLSGAFGTVHQVPQQTLERMQSNWQKLEGEVLINPE